MAATSTGRCGADWAPSTRSRAPRSRQIPAISRTGRTVPRTFEAWVTATSRVSSLTAASRSARSRPPPASGEKVGVVFEEGRHHPVALLPVKAGGDRPDRLGGVPGHCEGAALSPDERPDGVAGVPVAVGGDRGEPVDASPDVCAVAQVVLDHRLDH